MKQGYSAATPHKVHPSDAESSAKWGMVIAASSVLAAGVVSVGLYWPTYKAEGKKPLAEAIVAETTAAQPVRPLPKYSLKPETKLQAPLAAPDSPEPKVSEVKAPELPATPAPTASAAASVAAASSPPKVEETKPVTALVAPPSAPTIPPAASAPVVTQVPPVVPKPAPEVQPVPKPEPKAAVIPPVASAPVATQVPPVVPKSAPEVQPAPRPEPSAVVGRDESASGNKAAPPTPAPQTSPPSSPLLASAQEQWIVVRPSKDTRPTPAVPTKVVSPKPAVAPPPPKPKVEENPYKGLKPSTKPPVLVKPADLGAVLQAMSAKQREHYLTYTNKEWQKWMENLDKRSPEEKRERLAPLEKPIRAIMEQQMSAYEHKVMCLTCTENPQDPICKAGIYPPQYLRDVVQGACLDAANYLGAKATPVAVVVKAMGLKFTESAPQPAWPSSLVDLYRNRQLPTVGYPAESTSGERPAVQVPVYSYPPARAVEPSRSGELWTRPVPPVGYPPQRANGGRPAVQVPVYSYPPARAVEPPRAAEDECHCDCDCEDEPAPATEDEGC